MRIDCDPDEFETVYSSTPCPCGGTPGSDSCQSPGGCTASAGYTLRRRPPEVVARLKAERQRKWEDDILAQAETIRNARNVEVDGPDHAAQAVVEGRVPGTAD